MMMQMLLGAAQSVIQAFTGTLSEGFPQWTFSSNGSRSTFNSETPPQYWISPQSGMSAYSVRASTVSTTGTGSFTGTTGSFLNLGTSRTWSVLTDSPSLSATWVIDFEFRRDSDGVVVQTNRVTLISTP